MHGRRLATVEEVIAVASADTDPVLAALESWTADRGVGLSVVSVGDDVADVYRESRSTLGVTVGGDGTFLEGIKTFASRGVPILGVNRGTLSFLSRVEPEDVTEALDEIVAGHAAVDSRQQLRVDAPGLATTGVNDVTIQHVQPAEPFDRKVTRLDVFLDGEYVGQYEGTGLAIATPTGSTGISLSAGGPLQYPANSETLQLVGLHTHRLGTRPVVMDASAELVVVPRGPTSLVVDGGRAGTTIEDGAPVTVTGADTLAHVVRTSFDDQYFAAVTQKLGWGLRERDDEGPRELLPGPAEPAAEDELERARTVAEEAALSVGDVLRDLHGQVESVTVKSDKADIVTEADQQSDRIIRTVIEEEFPDHGLVSEESEPREGTSDYTWLVDPLDGTGNFAHGNPNYAVSIGLLDGTEPVVGVVYVPETGELFSARAGGDATENGVALATTDRDRVDESMLLSGYDPSGSFLAHFYEESRGVRRLGCASLHLCYLASGSADAVWEYDTYPWDVAAGVCVARAAGATITDEAGEPYRITLDTGERRALLGSNGPLHAELLAHLAGADQEVTG